MLRIDPHQLDALRADRRAGFIAELAAMLRQDFPARFPAPDEGAPDPAGPFAAAALQGAEAIGLSARREIRIFACLAAEEGLDWPEAGWAAPVLADDLLSPGQRLDICAERAVFRRLG